MTNLPPDAPTEDFARLIADNVGKIERVITIQARRGRLSADECDEFWSWVMEKLVDKDYARMRQFRGHSSWTTFLAVVITRLFHDYRNDKWGRWRPSAAAQRLGPSAVKLEALLERDQRPLREALEVLRSAAVPESDPELVRIAAQLPRRHSEIVGIEAVDIASDGPRTEPFDADAERVAQAIRNAINSLKPADQIITRMHFWSNETIANIARTLCEKEKPMYRRLERILRQLRSSLEAQGIDVSHLQDRLRHIEWCGDQPS